MQQSYISHATNSASHEGKVALCLALTLPVQPDVEFQMGGSQTTDTSGCGCSAGVHTAVSSGTKSGGEEKRKRDWAKEQMLNYGFGGGGERGIPLQLLLPRSQSVNHLLHGSNGTVHWRAGSAQWAEPRVSSWAGVGGVMLYEKQQSSVTVSMESHSSAHSQHQAKPMFCLLLLLFSCTHAHRFNQSVWWVHILTVASL